MKVTFPVGGNLRQYHFGTEYLEKLSEFQMKLEKKKKIIKNTVILLIVDHIYAKLQVTKINLR